MKPLIWERGYLKILDQRLLPFETKYENCYTYINVYDSIKDMKIRGAPVIGVAAAYGYYLGIKEIYEKNQMDRFKEIGNYLIKSRPTAVNLIWAINRMEGTLLKNYNNSNILKILEEEAIEIEKEEEEKSKKIAENGEKIIQDGDSILTHCNTGSLATLGPGTALGVIKYAFRNNKKIKVFYTETRPYLQGARLTGYELILEKIDSTLITDSMAGYVMKLGLVNKVIVGADRIAKNGDTANKIGTYSLSVLAKENKIPFYIAAPTSSIDFDIDSGNEIPIEERSKDEILYIKNVRIAMEGSKVYNPSFDVTPSSYISGIITEKGIIYPPFKDGILKISDL
ncbi:MAG: S-methyl-5-thioribose-1-phosphate isomerase [Caldisericia bacterium]